MDPCSRQDGQRIHPRSGSVGRRSSFWGKITDYDSQQYQKLRRESGKGSVTSTPKKGDTSSAQSTPRTGTARKRGRPSILDGLMPIPDQTEEPPSPTARKRIKMENAQNGERMMIKAEPVDENGVVLLDYDDE
jgi:hypothetical protein